MINIIPYKYCVCVCVCIIQENKNYIRKNYIRPGKQVVVHVECKRKISIV